MIVFVLLSSFAFAADPPKFGWKKVGQDTFSLDATEHKDFRLPKGRLRFQFKAEEAIYTGVANAQEYAPYRSGKYLELADFKKFHCVRTSVIETVADCNVPIANAVLAIR